MFFHSIYKSTKKDFIVCPEAFRKIAYTDIRLTYKVHKYKNVDMHVIHVQDYLMRSLPGLSVFINLRLDLRKN